MSLLFLESAAVGYAITRGDISLVPVYLPASVAPRIGAGTTGIEVTEAPDATVPTIRIVNTNPVPVLLAEGETVRGGQQDRTLDVSVLVPAAAEIDCPVSCVEQGRWGGRREFTRSSTFAPRRVRRAKQFSVERNLADRGVKRADQGLVWQTVDHMLTSHALEAPTFALAETDAVLERDERVAGHVRDLVGRGPLPAQQGVVVTHGRRVVAAEIFASPELLAHHWEALIRSAFLDRPAEVRGRPSLTAAVRFLRRFAGSPARSAEGVGLGTEFHARTDRLVGQALVWDQTLVHASAFALAA
jgi:hypothetical protein